MNLNIVEEGADTINKVHALVMRFSQGSLLLLNSWLLHQMNMMAYHFCDDCLHSLGKAFRKQANINNRDFIENCFEIEKPLLKPK